MDEKLIVTKFLRNEEQIKQDWLCLLMKDEKAPLDVSYRARLIKIVKEYYPIAVFSVTCEAEWQATSYWEHVEEYQVAREETVYIDYQGKEHKSSGRDVEVRNGRTIDHYRKPMTRTVYDTKRRTVIDNVQQTYGVVDPICFSERIWTGKGQSLINWIDRFDDSQLMEVKQDYFNDFQLIHEKISADSAKAQAENMGQNDISVVASRDVPGNRYENLSVRSNILDVSRKTYFLGVYHIFYEYEGKEYDCLMSGGNSIDDAVLGEHPVDNSIKERLEKIQSGIKENRKKKNWFLFGMIAISILIFFFALLAMSLSIVGEGVGVSLFFLLILGGGLAFCIYEFILAIRRRNKATAEMETLNADNANLKQKIYDLIQNDSISEEEKKKTIAQWLKDNERNLETIDFEKANTQDDILKQQVDKIKGIFKK